MPLHGSSLVFDVDASHLRIGLRVYFTALFLLLAFVGDQCCNGRVKVRLMKERLVRIPLLTGWLGGISAVRTWITQKRLPAGWLGIVMIAAEIMAFGSDLLVSGTVKTIQIPGRCAFGTGVVTPDKPVPWRSIPDFEQTAHDIVSQAQITSRENGGLSGIYRKANGAPNFRADSQDVLGYWNCVDVQHDVVYETPEFNISEATNDLVSKGYLYDAFQSWCGETFPDGSWDSFVIWSASVPDEVGKAWEVKASVDISDFTPAYDKPQAMRNYHCVMNAPSYEWILGQIRAESTFPGWCMGLYKLVGGTGGPRASNITSIIESVLESMVMIGYGHSVDTSSTPYAGDTTQGCLIAQAEIPWPVFTLLVLASVGGFLMLIYWTYLIFQLHWLEKRRLSSHRRKCIKENTPNGLVGWMEQAVREHEKDADQMGNGKDLRHWGLGQVDDGSLRVHFCGLKE